MDINKIDRSFIAGELADKLDAKDGKKDNKIGASIWNQFANEVGGNKIKDSIDTYKEKNGDPYTPAAGVKSIEKYLKSMSDEDVLKLASKYGVEYSNMDDFVAHIKETISFAAPKIIKEDIPDIAGSNDDKHGLGVLYNNNQDYLKAEEVIAKEPEQRQDENKIFPKKTEE